MNADEKIRFLEKENQSLKLLLRQHIELKAQAHDALSFQMDRIDGLINSAPVGFFVVRPNLYYSEVNNFFAESLGKEVHQYTDQTIGSVEEPGGLVQPVVEFIENKEQRESKAEVNFTIDNVEFNWLLIMHRRHGNGDVSVLGIDINERIEAERYSNRMRLKSERLATDLREKSEEINQLYQKAQSANEAKSAFLAMISHEIRTPMNGILGMSHLLLTSQLEPDQEAQINVIQQSGQSLLSIINDLLDISKIEAGKLEIEEVEFDLREIVDAVILQYQPAAKEQRTHLSCLVHPNVPKIVMGDPVRVRQILLNLLGNAIKFTEAGEVLAEISSSPEDPGRLNFAIVDTGIGMSEAVQKKLFAAFTQADISTTRKYGGTGLGLNICKNLINKMGGSIAVKSAKGIGSLFNFDLRLGIPDSSLSKAQIDHEEKRFESITIRSNLRLFPESAQRIASCHAHRVETVTSLDDEITIELIDTSGNLFNAELSGDTITIRELDRCFSTEFASRKDPESRKSHRQNWQKSKMNLNILLAEDIAQNQLIARKFLERMGCCVTIANNGKEAVDFYTTQDFDLVFMDYQMPIMDGLEATKAIRNSQKPDSCSTPIIGLSGNVMRGFKEECLELGMNDLLAKPYDPNEIETCLRIWSRQVATASVE